MRPANFELLHKEAGNAGSARYLNDSDKDIVVYYVYPYAFDHPKTHFSTVFAGETFVSGNPHIITGFKYFDYRQVREDEEFRRVLFALQDTMTDAVRIADAFARELDR